MIASSTFLWGDEPPPSATHALQALVSRLRPTLGDDRLETTGTGVSAAGGERRGRRVAFRGAGAGRARVVGPAEVALGVFDEALGLWRGSPYAEFASEEFATAEVARLVELRARAIEERSAALLELGRPEEVIGELEAEIAVEPFRERLRALLMLALARAGRPVESLRAYDAFRRFLADEVGVVPSPGLQELNDDIVRQHPDVGWAGSPTKDAGTAELPSGTVTFFFTEVEGSTRLWEEHPDAMRDAMARHDELLRDAVESHDGLIVKTTGDGFHAVFATAHDAVAAAVAAQTGAGRGRLEHRGDRSRPDGDAYRRGRGSRRRLLRQRGEPRRAADVGGARRTDRRVAGDRRAARTTRCPRSTGSSTWVSTGCATWARPERVFQVHASRSRAGLPPLRTLDAFPRQPAVAADSFVGREGDVAEIAQVLREKRLVTLTGWVASARPDSRCRSRRGACPRFRDGAWLCELAAVRDPAGVVDAVARVFRVTARPGMSLEESLVAYLA